MSFKVETERCIFALRLILTAPPEDFWAGRVCVHLFVYAFISLFFCCDRLFPRVEAPGRAGTGVT
jgi:hypothetical protein